MTNLPYQAIPLVLSLALNFTLICKLSTLKNKLVKLSKEFDAFTNTVSQENAKQIENLKEIQRLVERRNA